MSKERGGCMNFALDIMLFSIAAVVGYSGWRSAGEPRVAEMYNRLRVPSIEKYIYVNFAFGSSEEINKTVPWIVDKRTGKIILGPLEFAGSFRTEKY